MLSSHGEAWEGDEEGADERQGVTEPSKARGQEEEADTGEEEDELTGTHCSSVGTARRRRKLRGAAVQREDDDEGELLGINGEAKDGRGSAANDNSGYTTVLAGYPRSHHWHGALWGVY